MVAEIRTGIEKVRRRDPAAAAGLEAWLGALVASHAERILPVDLRVAEEWGRLAARRSLPVVDGLMAATALVHGLTLVTRNVKDVSGTGAVVLDPFKRELSKREGELAKACAAANADSRLAEEIDEWQAFDDVPPPLRPAMRTRKGKE